MITIFHQKRPTFHQTQSEGGDGGWAKKGKKIFLLPSPKKNPSPVRISQTPRAGTGDSMGWFRRYRWSTLINLGSNLSIPVRHFLEFFCLFMNYCQAGKRTTIWIWMQLLENLVILTPNIDLLYQRIVQSWFASIPSSEAYISESHQKSEVFNQRALPDVLKFMGSPHFQTQPHHQKSPTFYQKSVNRVLYSVQKDLYPITRAQHSCKYIDVRSFQIVTSHGQESILVTVWACDIESHHSWR